MKPTITIDKPKAPTIRMNEGARNAIVPMRRGNQEVIKVPASERAAGVLGGVASVVGSLVPSFGFSYSGGNKTDNRQIDNRKYDQRSFNDNRQVTNVDGRTYVDEHNTTYIDHDETNITAVSDSYNTTSYSAQSYTSNAYTDNSVTSVSIDNSQHYTDASQHYTTNITDNSQHYTDNSRHLALTSVNNTQSVILALFFGDGLEKVLMALVMLGVLVTIFLTELLLIAGGLAAFIVVYKTAKFAWQRSEADKTRKHELELARLNNRPVLHIHVNSPEQAAKVVERMNKPQVKQPEALPEPTFFEADAPSAVSPTKTEQVKAAAKKHAKKQANLFIDGMKHDVIGVSRKGKKS